jgi:8-oxo-dGTP diphosphatase
MAKSSKLVAVKRGKVLLVRRKRDRLWMFSGGRKRARESEKDCFVGRSTRNCPSSGLGTSGLGEGQEPVAQAKKMSDAIFISRKARGALTIGDKKEIDKALRRNPRGVRLTP